MPILAINGGQPIRSVDFPAHNFIGEEEKRAVSEVLDSGNLSGFLGAWNKDYFYGGPAVRRFEDAWSTFIGCRFVVSMNSATSGLVAAMSAAGVGPGDEVIVPPLTMSASVTSVIACNAVPVFADVEPGTFCLNPLAVEKKITARTKAILTVDLCGQPSDLRSLRDIADRDKLVLIEDAAQAPGAKFGDQFVGSIADMTVFSLNIHKHIHAGEGGMVTTNLSSYAEKLQLIRNHGEAVVANKHTTDISNSFGFNWRLTELSAAIASTQLIKLPKLLEWRIANANYLANELSKIPGIISPLVRTNCRHTYYIQPFLYNEDILKTPRNHFIAAVSAELPSAPDRRGIPMLWTGLGRPLYELPIYQQQIAYGRSGCPFKCPLYNGAVNYHKGLCPIAEQLTDNKVFVTDYIRPPATISDLDDVVKAFWKVYEHRNELS